MKKTPASAMRRYLAQTIALGLCYLALALGIMFLFFDKLFVAYLIIVLLYLPYRLLFQRIVFHNILSAIYRDLDPQRFRETVTSWKRFVIPPMYRAIWSLHEGDYQTLIDLCSTQIPKIKNPQNKIIPLSYLARAYFELNDVKRLTAVCDEIDALVRGNSKISGTHPIVRTSQFYRCYAEGKYEACFALREQFDRENTPKFIDYNLRRATGLYNNAVLFFRTGDMENAKALFTSVITDAPKLHIARLAATYLTAIETGNESPLQAKEYVPTPHYELPNQKSIDRSSKRRKIFFLLFILLLICMLFATNCPNDALRYPAIYEQYGNFSLCATFPLQGESAQEIYFIEVNGQLHLVGPRSDDRTNLWIYEENIAITDMPLYHSVKIHGSEQSFHFIICEEHFTDSHYPTQAFPFNGQNCYIICFIF